jgi:hypothetical protein
VAYRLHKVVQRGCTYSLPADPNRPWAAVEFPDRRHQFAVLLESAGR